MTFQRYLREVTRAIKVALVHQFVCQLQECGRIARMSGKSIKLLVRLQVRNLKLIDDSES